MAKSARASRIKKNKSALRQKVFGPVETARNERLSAKLLELAKAPKPEKEDMDVEEEANKDTKADSAAAEASMDVDGAAAKTPKSKRELNRIRSQRVEKKHRRVRNQVTFPSHSKKKGGKR